RQAPPKRVTRKEEERCAGFDRKPACNSHVRHGSEADPAALRATGNSFARTRSKVHRPAA
ncbi:MAG: hypothetical protein AB1733_25055, partial [Thermodesulfobacteriota bacterium]